MTPTTHELKTDPLPFGLTMDGKKPYEVRLNDRDFKINDRLILRETVYSHDKMRNAPDAYPLKYSGRELFASVSCVTASPITEGLQDGYVTLGLANVRLLTDIERDERIAAQVQKKKEEPEAPTSVDRKFRIHAENRATGVVRTDEEAILFLAKDDAVPDMLDSYRALCVDLEADKGQLDSIDLLIDRVHIWREANPDKCKTPDMSEAERPIQINGEFTE
ncbi:DUF3850 domain-containing protein [Candidatus Pacearchaeota archaeon]|nr:DUF3850 domain-containing protein [Candidatus Pacearchaeota archaeon]